MRTDVGWLTRRFFPFSFLTTVNHLPSTRNPLTKAQVATFDKMTSGTLSSLFVLLLSCTPTYGQSQDTQAVQFNQVLNVNGDVSCQVPISWYLSANVVR